MICCNQYGKVKNNSMENLLYKLTLLTTICTIILSTVGCNNNEYSSAVDTGVPNETATVSDNFYEFTDFLGNDVVLDKKPEKVISLLGSYAETWILSGGSLIGVTDDAISERSLLLGKETEIIGTVKEPNIESILELSPDFVILSPDIQNHLDISETLKLANIPYAFFHMEFFEDYLKILKIFTDITGNSELYYKNGLVVQNQIKSLLEKLNSDESYKNKKPSVLFIRASSNGAKAMKDDSLTGKILIALNCNNIATHHRSLLEDLSIEEIVKEDPEFIFVTTMGNEEQALDAFKKEVQANSAWSNLSAVKNGHYIILPKELFHYKPNNRWGESYEYIAKILYPEIYK